MFVTLDFLSDITTFRFRKRALTYVIVKFIRSIFIAANSVPRISSNSINQPNNSQTRICGIYDLSCSIVTLLAQQLFKVSNQETNVIPFDISLPKINDRNIKCGDVMLI